MSPESGCAAAWHRSKRPGRLLAAIAAAAIAPAALPASAGLTAVASASSNQVSIIQDDRGLQIDPAGTLIRMRDLGADQVRLAVRWDALAPAPDSRRRPRGFRASDPAAYRPAAWSLLDTVVRDAAADGIQMNFNVVGGAPLWATGPGAPGHGNWEPSAAEFGQFMRALATRYSGDYDPQTARAEPGNSADLPRVSFWSIWNEPDYGPSLAPQALPGHPGVEDSPRMYRGLVAAAWSALHATGHGFDHFIFGELAPRSVGTTFGKFNGMLPLVFLRAMYCLDSAYHQLRGRAAALRGCPTNASGSRRFAAQNPALFHAAGFSDHPYMRWYPPNHEEDSPRVRHFSTLVRQFTTLGVIGNLQYGLRRVVSAYGSRVRFPIWNTEFGYITDPPKRIWSGNHSPYVSPTVAADYDNWAEYISWRNPQIASFEQYLLSDPLPALRSNNYGGFASGLLTYSGQPKPGYGAWRLPLFLPRTTAAGPNQPLEVWGAVRPVRYASLDAPGQPELAEIMFAPGNSPTFAPLATVTLNSAGEYFDPLNPPQTYFDTRLRFPASGSVKLQWTYPGGGQLGYASQTFTSRTVRVTVK